MMKPTTPAQLTNVEDIRAFALAGNARLTLESAKTGSRFTFRLRKLEDKPVFISVLTGANNESDFSYIGTLFANGEYRHGRKSRISADAPSAKAIAWFADKVLAKGRLPADLHVWHEGRCGRCGRVLTVPESIARGIGPECAGKLA